MVKRFLYYTLSVNLLLLFVIRNNTYGIGGSIIEVFFSMLFLMALIALPISLITAATLVITEIVSSYAVRGLRQVYRKIPSQGKSEKLRRRLLGIFLTAEEEENILGDLREECSRFESNREVRVWLCKQIIKSILPLLYKNLKARIASYFGERIR